MTVTQTRNSEAADALAARLDDPETASALLSILDHADLLAVMVTGLSGLIARGDTISDSLADAVKELASASEGAMDGLDVGGMVSGAAQMAKALPRIAPGLSAAADSGIVERLVAADVFGPEAVNTISVLARGLSRGAALDSASPQAVHGPLSMLKALRDDDVSRALNFFLSIAKAVGQELADSPPGASPSTPTGTTPSPTSHTK